MPMRRMGTRTKRGIYVGKAKRAVRGRVARTKRTVAKYRAKKLRRSAPTAKVSSAPVQMGTSVSGGLQSSFTQKQMGDGSLRITGRSFITQIDTNNKYTNGLVAVHDCNPVLLNDRVATISTTYEKYVYQSVTYRYVPQCSTTTAGSVMLTFERDPANPAANGGDGNFMQNVMSYEHTAITPPWVGSSVTYKREKSEKKLFWISGQGSNYDARDTSQGMFMCYGTNLPVNTGLGFIVMDYVLDLCQPSIMPARTGAGIAGPGFSTNIPSQWQFTAINMIEKSVLPGSTINANGLVPVAFNPATLFTNQNSDCIIDLLLEGTALPSAGNNLWSTSEFNAKAVAPVPTTLARGSHLYLVLRRGVATLTPANTQSNFSVGILTRNLADAIAALSGTYDGTVLNAGSAYAFSNALYPIQTLAQNSSMQLSGFYRQLTLRASDDFQV